MGSGLGEAREQLEVDSGDLREMRRQRRRDRLTSVAQVFTPLVSAVIGVFAAESAYPIVPHINDSYPYLPLASVALPGASAGRTYFPRRSWTGTVVLSVGLFIAAFLLIALLNTAANGNFGVTTKYGVFSWNRGSGG